MTHYFVAIPIPYNLIKHQLDEVRNHYPIESHYKVIPHESDYHITIQFFGALNEDEKERAIRVLHEMASSVKPMKIVINGLSYFGSVSGPRVVFLSIEHNAHLTSLYEQSCDQLKDILKNPTRKSYVPHITIAKKSILGNSMPIKKETFDPIEHHVSSMTLFRICPSSVPKYVSETVFPFQG